LSRNVRFAESDTELKGKEAETNGGRRKRKKQQGKSKKITHPSGQASDRLRVKKRRVR
jgi:hypothetical protein